MLLIELDIALAFYIAISLDLGARQCRDNGVPIPAELEQLTATCWQIARRGDVGRPEPTSLADLLDALDARPVKLLYTIAEAATVLGVSERQAERLIASGELPSVLIGRARRISTADLETFVASLGGSSFRDHVATKATSGGPPPSAPLVVGMRPGRSATRPTSPASAQSGGAA